VADPRAGIVREGSSSRRRRWLLSIGVALVTVVAFAGVLRNDFVDLDDQYAFTITPAYRGLGWAQIRWMFTTTRLENYVPVTWLRLGLDYLLWGMDPAGYYLTNVVLHGVNAGLLAVVIRRLLLRATSFGGADLDAAADTGALAFSLNPLRVESVAWISERRDVLSGMFFLLTLLFYLGAATEVRRRRWHRGVSIAAYLLAVLSKPTVVTLPLLLPGPLPTAASAG
jgi:hypothetical protein